MSKANRKAVTMQQVEQERNVVLWQILQQLRVIAEPTRRMLQQEEDLAAASMQAEGGEEE